MMGPNIFLAIVSTLLVVSLAWNGVQVYLRRDRDSAWRTLLQSCDDRGRADERHHQARVDALLDRLHTSPRVELDARTPGLPPLQDRTSWPDTEDPNPIEDEAWDLAHDKAIA